MRVTGLMGPVLGGCRGAQEALAIPEPQTGNTEAWNLAEA